MNEPSQNVRIERYSKDEICGLILFQGKAINWTMDFKKDPRGYFSLVESGTDLDAIAQRNLRRIMRVVVWGIMIYQREKGLR